MRHLCAVAVLGTLMLQANALAQVPQKISYQGLLTNPDGTPVPDGSYNLTFALYTVPSGGSPIWHEIYMALPMSKGTFNVVLGSLTPLAGVNMNQQLYLGVTKGTDPEFSPRTLLTSAPSSLAPWSVNGSNISYSDGNVGVGSSSPAARLHVKGSDNSPQLTIDASSGQTNANPLVKLRNSNGTDLLHIHSDDTSNTFVGLRAGTINNILSGGRDNTFLGSLAGANNTYGQYNTAIGSRALSSVTANNNTAIGFSALLSNMASGNTAVGSQALQLNTTGNLNTAIGARALWTNSTGYSNTASGYQALYSNQNGYQNTASGNNALANNISGNNNTGLGALALSTNTAGSGNTAIGVSALGLNSTGSSNTASGVNALYNNTSGGSNTAHGLAALYSNTTANGNTAIGSGALRANATGLYSAAGGFEALYGNTESYNTGFGAYTLWATGASQYNTAVGFRAGDSYNNGYNNVFVGANADVNVAGLFNVIAIGQGTTVTASSTARFGNSSTTSYGGWANWTNVSDARFKKNIRENVPGLDFISKLRPVTYNFDATGMDAFLHKNQNPAEQLSEAGKAVHEQALRAKEQVVYTGFVAQEVEEAARSLGFDFSGVDAPKNENDYYGLRYAEFVVPLVKAVQEQQQMMKEQERVIEELRKEINELKRRK